MQVEKFEKFTV